MNSAELSLLSTLEHQLSESVSYEVWSTALERFGLPDSYWDSPARNLHLQLEEEFS